MPLSENRQYRYPSAKSGPDLAAHLAALAEDVDLDVTGVAAAAQESAEEVTARLAQAEDRLPDFGDAPGFLGGLLDKNNRETWLGARTLDGGPTETAVGHLRSRLGLGHEETGLDLLAAVLDAEGNLTDMAVRKTDGQFPDYVIDHLAPRIGSRLGVTSPADYFMDSGSLRRLNPDTTRAAVWGSSTTELIGPSLAAMFNGLGVSFHQGGKGAERGEHTCARLGSIPALLTIPGGTLPSSGSVTVTSSNMQTWQGLREYEGRLGGVLCSLSSTASVMTLTRKTSGSAVAVPADTPFLPTLGPSYREAVNIINMGKNSLTGLAGPALTAAQVAVQIDRSFEFFSPLVKRVLVMGHFVDTANMTDSMVSHVHAVNAYAADRYGPLYVDVQKFLTSPKLWEYTGLSPTAEDLAQQSAGRKPSSVSADASHLNAAGNSAVTRLIREHMLTLSWYGDN